MAPLARALAWIGWVLLGVLTLAGLALSAVAFVAAVPFTRPLVASVAMRLIDEQIAGGIVLRGISVLPQGGLELRGVEVYDPDGHLVLAVGRARVSVDVTELRSRIVGLAVDLEAPSVLIEQEADGGTSLARAFAPSRPAAPRARDGVPEAEAGGGAWTVHLSRVDLRGGELWWKDAAGATRAEAAGIDVSARGTLGPRRARVEVRLSAQLRTPLATPVSLEVVAARAGDAVRCPVLHLEAGGTALDALAEGDLARRRGRVVVRRVEVSRADARALVPAAPAGADLSAEGYGESDGETLTAALRVEPAGEGRAGGEGDVAVAARLDALRRAAGFDVALDRLDPSRIAAALPSGEVTLSGHGAVAGATLDDLRARLALTVARARLGRGELTRAQVALRVARGTWELDRFSAAVPGATVDASGRWRRGGPISGTATVDASDLAAAVRNGAHLASASPPPVAGRVRLEAAISGTSDTPSLAGRIDAPVLRAGTVAAEGVHLAVRAAGPRASPSGQVEGRIVSIREGARERAREIALKAGLAGGEGSLSARAMVPGLGTDPVVVDARGVLDRARDRVEIPQLAIAYPGSRWVLARPATVDLRARAVDRLVLQDPPQALAVEGGMGPRALSLHVQLTRLDLARLPAGVLPRAGVRGEVSGDVAVTGPPERPSVAARLSVENGGYGPLGAIAAAVDGQWNGATRRASGSVSVLRGEGGTLDAQAEIPLPLAGRGREPVRVKVRAAALPIPELLAAAGRDLPAQGKLGVTLEVSGTAAAPAAAAEITIADGVWADLEGLGAVVAIEAAGATAHVLASGTLGGRRVVGLDASAPLDLGDLVARPDDTLRGLGRAPLRASLSILSLDLATVAGRAGAPRDLAGIVEGHAELTGTAAAPRGKAALALTGGTYGAWGELGASLEATAAETALAASVRITIHGEEAVRLRATLGLRPERLLDRAALAAAPLRIDADVPKVALGRAAGHVLPLEGTLEGRVAIGGTLRAPELTADLSGAGVLVKDHPLGDARASARYARGRGDAELTLWPTSGGTLRATLAVTAEVGLGARGPSLGDAPAEARAVAERLDLGFVPAVAPGIVRTAAGTLAMDVRATGPLRRLVPRGTLHVAGGRLAVVELGEWTEVNVEARVTDDDVELSRFDVRRGRGKLSATAAVRGLRSGQGRVTARLTASDFTVSRAGMDVVTLDVLDVDATGTWTPTELALEVKLPRETVRLPKRPPRTLQPLDGRKDIVIGRHAERRQGTGPAAAAGRAEGKAFAVRVHAVAPGKLFVKSDDPKIDIELKADVRYEREEGEDYVSGAVEVVRGNVEPIGGRNFTIDHGVVRFTNGPPDAALLDIQAKYVNPAATVTARVSGTIHSPDLKLTSSVPQMTDADIALLLLTGRTQPKAGSGGVGSVTGEEAGMAVVGVFATQAFKNLVQNKLPLDTVALDAGGFRAGKYLTDRIYVGYVRRWDADPTQYQNTDEVRVEYQISQRWSFESRYGNAQSGGANLIWSRDY